MAIALISPQAGNAAGVLTVLLCMGLFRFLRGHHDRAALLGVSDLAVEFRTRRGIVQGACRMSIFASANGETLGMVGESGSGKSVTAYAVMGILDRAGRIAGGSYVLRHRRRRPRENAMREMRGREISMIFQNPRAALNPIRKVGKQIEDVLRQHVQARRSDRGEKAIEVLAKVRSPTRASARRLSVRAFGRHVPARGDRDGAGLRAAAADRRRADHRARHHDAKAVMDLIVELAASRNMATLLITHDLGLAAEYCDRIAVMQPDTWSRRRSR